MLGLVGENEKAVATIVVSAVAAGHESEAIIRATIRRAIESDAEGGVAVKVGFFEDFATTDDVGRSYAVDSGGESVAWVENFKRAKGEGRVRVEETTAVVHVAHDAITGVDGGVSYAGRFADVEAVRGRGSRACRGRICVIVARGGIGGVTGFWDRGEVFFGNVPHVEFFQGA